MELLQGRSGRIKARICRRIAHSTLYLNNLWIKNSEANYFFRFETSSHSGGSQLFFHIQHCHPIQSHKTGGNREIALRDHTTATWESFQFENILCVFDNFFKVLLFFHGPMVVIFEANLKFWVFDSHNFSRLNSGE